MSTVKRSTALSLARGKDYTPTPRLVKVTPKLAEDILTKNTMNRPLRSGRVERYARDMKGGHWRSNGETIKITEDGALLDGQHRLFAVIEAGVTIEMLIVEGLDPDVMPTIDTGAGRHYGDVLSIQGGKNTAQTAAVLRWLYWYGQDPRPTKSAAMSITHSELAKVDASNPDVPDRVREVQGAIKRTFMPPGILAFVYTMAYRVDPSKAGAWLELLASGAGMDGKHPIHQLRERLIQNRTAKAKLPQTDICALAIKSWTHFVSGKRTNVLTWRVTEPFPVFGKGR